MNRLIRVSSGPFQLLDLQPGAVELVRNRTLADQLGPRLAAELGLNRVAEEEKARRKGRSGAKPGGGTMGFLHVIKPTADGAEAVKKIQLEGEANAQPAVAGGKLYVHTRKHLYCFKIGSGKITLDKEPEAFVAKPGPAKSLRIVPQEVLLNPGEKATFRIQTIDANGLVVGDSKPVKWESFIPPTAKVKATAAVPSTLTTRRVMYNTPGPRLPGAEPSAGSRERYV